IQNRESAMRILRARLIAKRQDEIEKTTHAARKSQIRAMDRSERIRTYNFPENRVVDHRTGYKAYNLDQVLNGDVSQLIRSCIEADTDV
ncbi:peptide chain release factor-like protein, partial [Tropheryma whipplei]